MKTKKTFDTKKLVMAAVMTALVIIFQVIGITPVFGPFSTALGLIPILIGAVLCGPYIGAWLGFIFSVVALCLPSTWGFLAIDAFGTLVTVIVKGTACGFVAGITYKFLLRVNDIFAMFVAGVVIPVVNTGLFMLGALAFMTDDLSKFQDAGEGFVDASILFWGYASVNFIFEFAMCVLIVPVAIKLVFIATNKINSKRKRKHGHHHRQYRVGPNETNEEK
ncbi:MAG: ECF transporter S component [Ruminococcaceae bacterium]|nr:ECF transporter S component [Oscillospiraceae bacterium]